MSPKRKSASVEQAAPSASSVSPPTKKSKGLKSAFDEHFDSREAVAKAHHASNALIIRAMQTSARKKPFEVPGETAKQKLVRENSYTAADMASVRLMLMTKRRMDKLESAAKLLLGKQAGKDVMAFNTDFSHHMEESLERVLKSILRLTPAVAFDTLLGFTIQLKTHSTWLEDNELLDTELFTRFGAVWAKLLANEDAKLEIDAEFTRPGVLEMLQQLKAMLDAAKDAFDPPMQWDFECDETS